MHLLGLELQSGCWQTGDRLIAGRQELPCRFRHTILPLPLPLQLLFVEKGFENWESPIRSSLIRTTLKTNKLFRCLEFDILRSAGKCYTIALFKPFFCVLTSSWKVTAAVSQAIWYLIRQAIVKRAPSWIKVVKIVIVYILVMEKLRGFLKRIKKHAFCA